MGGDGSTDASSGSSSSTAPLSSGEATSSAPKATLHENHPFFSYYASLVHQQNMLQDLERTSSYHAAICGNASDFAGKVVVDVGTGSGILAIFAARAGARHVYALEASGVARHARALVAANGLADVITVLECKAEEAELPERADVLVSEPMGFMLVHERMLETFLTARERFLKPGGLCFPTRGTVHVAPFTDATLHAEQAAKAAFWGTSDFYGIDLRSLADAAARDHFAQPIVGYVDPASLLGAAVGPSHHTIDFARDTPASLHAFDVPFECVATKTAVCHGVATWFDVAFPGVTQEVTLSTGPSSPPTHWYQARVLLPAPIAINAGQRLAGALRCVANARYSYDLTLTMRLVGGEATTHDGSPVESVAHCSLADQAYSSSSSSYASGATQEKVGTL